MSHCEGKKIVFLSAHCIPTNEFWLEKLDCALNVNQNIYCAYGRQLPLSITSDMDRRDLINTFGLDPKVQIKDFFFHNANSIVHAEYIKKFPFDNQATNVEDRLWANEVINRGDRIGYTPEACVFHYHGINHDNEPNRLRRVTSIIRPLYENDSWTPVKFFRTNVSVLVIIMSNETKQIDPKVYETVLNTLTLSHIRTDKVIVSRFPAKVDATINFLRADFAHLDDESILLSMKLILKKTEESSGKFYDHVVFVNPEYVNLQNQVLERLINHHFSELLDVTFCGKLQKSNVWQNTVEGLLPLQSNKLFSEDRESLVIAYYGLGVIATRSTLFSGLKVPQFIGVLELPTDYNTERKRLN